MNSLTALFTITILSTLSTLAAPTISQEVYSYSYYGKTAVAGAGCIDYTERRQYYSKTGAPIPTSDKWITKYWVLPPECNGDIWQTDHIWTDRWTMTNANTTVYKNGVMEPGYPIHCDPCLPSDVKFLTREMANYTDKNVGGILYTRQASGLVRFWMTGANNATYVVKVTIIAWYWPNWWPGAETPDDANRWSNGATLLNYVSDQVKINLAPCNAAGQATLFWNPVLTPFLNMNVTVANPAKNQHWQYLLATSITGGG